MSGWFTSAMNYDMMSPNPWSTMNLHMNQLWDHSSAWNGMFSVPQYSFNNFMPYGDMYGNAYLTNPMYTLNQMSWGTPAWSNMPWNNGGNMGNMWSPWGWNGSNFNSNGSSNTNTDTATNRKYNRLLTLVNQLIKAEEFLSPSEIDALNEAKRNTKGTKEEQYERLLKAYNEIDKDTIRDFLMENGHMLGVSSDVKGQAKNKDTFYHRLLHTGFEYDSEMDDKVEEFYDGIKSLKGSDGTDWGAEGLLTGIKDGTYDILDFVSSWNSNYKDDSDSSRVIEHFAKHYKEIEDKDQQDSARKILELLVDEMIDKALEVKKVLNNESKEAIEDAISNVRDALNNTKADGGSSVDSNLSDAFDKLYLYTRQAAMVKLRNDAKVYYGEIDSKVFNDKLFDDEVVKDLESEGFSSDEIEGTEVTISEKRAKRASRAESNDDDDDDDAMKGIDKKAAIDQVATLKAEGVLEELSVKKDGTITLYQEKTMTGDSDGDGKADYAKIFYINADGKLVEWENTKLKADGTGTEIVKAGIAQGETIVKASDIAKGKKAKEEKKRKKEVVPSDAQNIVKVNNNEELCNEKPTAWKNGENIAGLLIGNTVLKDRNEAHKLIMNEIKAENVFVTLAGYEDDDACGDDIIAQIILKDSIGQKRAEWINHIMTCAKENIEAQLQVEKSKANPSQAEISKFQNDISSLESYIQDGVKNEATADKVDSILKKYIDDVHANYNGSGWFHEAIESVGNFFCNFFDWG